MQLNQFLELFNPLPGNHYLQIATQEDEITSAMSALMQKVGGEFKVVLYNEEHLAFDKPFRAIPRDNDIVLIKDVYHKHQNKDMMLKLTYLTLANTANVIIMEKKGLLDIEATKATLEAFEFRAPNEIEIVEGYDLVMAKKMHMWGNGL